MEDGKKYLQRLGVSVDDVRQADFGAIKVSGTPTLLLVDDKGVVKGRWVGKLLPDQENEVANKVL